MFGGLLDTQEGCLICVCGESEKIKCHCKYVIYTLRLISCDVREFFKMHGWCNNESLSCMVLPIQVRVNPQIWLNNCKR